MTKTLDRRAFLRFANPAKRMHKTNATSPKPPTATLLSGLSEYNGTWDTEQIAHLLRRTMFGAKNLDISFFKTMSPTEAVDWLLKEPPQPLPPVNDYGAFASDPGVPAGTTWVNAPYNFGLMEWRTASLKCWWLGNMLNQTTSLREKMVLFWHNHIPVEFTLVNQAQFSYRYLKTLYEFAFGNFKNLVRALTIDPAMLVYLNGNLNSAGAPDENYARELQELFCIGKGPGSNYSEEDVQAAARVLTGWKTPLAEPEPYFDPGSHDTDDKQFSAFYGNAVITGKAGPAGAEELDELLDLIFENEETARFICRKLYTFFVYQELTDEIESNIIEPLAELLRDHDYEVKPVLEVLLKSEHFFDPWFRGSMLKSPLEQVVGMCREMHVQFPPETEFQELFQLRLNLYDYLPNMLQAPGDPPDVAGWPAWFQAPIFYKYWITVSTLPRRAEHTDMLLFTGYASGSHVVGIDVVAFTETLPDPSDPNELVDEAIRLFYGIEVADEVKQHFKSFLLTGQTNDYYWTNAWYDYYEDPGNAAAYNVVQSRLQAFYQAVFQLEEYQLL